MKDRFELFSIFKGFIAEIQNQFGVSIRNFCSDNALEYYHPSFRNLCLNLDLFTKHLVHTLLNKNGVVERKNRHLIETTRALLIKSHVPLHFWGNAVLSSCYLIN